MPVEFAWQIGFGAFSYAKSQTDAVVKYVLNQEEFYDYKKEKWSANGESNK